MAAARQNPGMNRFSFHAAALACASTFLLHTAWAQDTRLEHGQAVAPARVLVLGTAHLASSKQAWDAAALEPVIARLVAFRPDVIAVESIPGSACDFMARTPAKFDPADLRRYCADTAQAAAATGLDIPAATAQLDAALKTWPADASPAQRRHLVALALAAGEPGTARLQWQQLAAAERRAEDGLSADLVAQLDRRRSGELDLLAIPVAARSGLSHLLAMDDHTGDAIDVADPDAFLRSLNEAWRGGADAVRAAQAQEAALAEHRDALGLYRHLNDPAVRRAAADADLGAASRDASAQHYGRMYAAGWETRNLRMAANIAAAIRDRPDARVLVIVGAQHKPWLDRILGQMADVDIVDAEALLR
jgi:hypothetical protein